MSLSDLGMRLHCVEENAQYRYKADGPWEMQYAGQPMRTRRATWKSLRASMYRQPTAPQPQTCFKTSLHELSFAKTIVATLIAKQPRLCHLLSKEAFAQKAEASEGNKEQLGKKIKDHLKLKTQR